MSKDTSDQEEDPEKSNKSNNTASSQNITNTSIEFLPRSNCIREPSSIIDSDDQNDNYLNSNAIKRNIINKNALVLAKTNEKQIHLDALREKFGKSTLAWATSSGLLRNFQSIRKYRGALVGVKMELTTKMVELVKEDYPKYGEEVNKFKPLVLSDIKSNISIFSIIPKAELTNLTVLNLSYCKITNLPMHMFSELLIKILDLSCNYIQDLQPTIFNSLTNLKMLNLSGNKINHMQAELYNELKNLKLLDLSDNKIEKLTKNIFRNLDNIEELYLDANELTELDSEIFSGMRLLVILELSSNKFTKPDLSFSANLAYLKELCIDDDIYDASYSMDYSIESSNNVGLPAITEGDIESSTASLSNKRANENSSNIVIKKSSKNLNEKSMQLE